MKQITAFRLEHTTGGDFEVMVDAREVIEIGGTAKAAHFGIRDGVTHALEARHERGAGAHRAGLLGHVERCAVEPPVADAGGGLSEREHLGVGGGIVGCFDGVVGRGDDLAAMLDHAADGHFVDAPGIDGLIVGEAHKKHVVAHELRRKSFFERTIRWWVWRWRRHEK